MTSVYPKRTEDGRHFYEAPCCMVVIGIVEGAEGCKCPVCGCWLRQNGNVLTLEARVHQWPNMGAQTPTITKGGTGTI